MADVDIEKLEKIETDLIDVRERLGWMRLTSFVDSINELIGDVTATLNRRYAEEARKTRGRK